MSGSSPLVEDFADILLPPLSSPQPRGAAAASYRQLNPTAPRMLEKDGVIHVQVLLSRGFCRC